MSAASKPPWQPAAGEGEALATTCQMEKPASEAVGEATVASWNRLMRLDRRRRLRAALAGTPAERWDYAVARVLAPCQSELIAYGTCIFDARRGAEQARRHFWRLEAIARVRGATLR